MTSKFNGFFLDGAPPHHPAINVELLFPTLYVVQPELQERLE